MFPQVFGKYVLERELARGGMARVLLATLRGAGGFEKKLVVKQIRDELSMDEQFVRRFVEEAKTTVALSHPNIVPVYELGVELGTYFLAMELVEGVSVAELLRALRDGSSPRLSPEEGAYVGVEVCRALDYAHRRMNVVHRDVTPRNVLIDEEGQVKVIDFGIAAPASAVRQEVFGSPGHMPPEQIEGKKLTPATDIFAVAVLLMEAWSGKPPFRRKTAAECEAAMAGPHPKPSDADPRLLPLDDIIGRAMALDPLARPQGAEELGRALRRFLDGVDLGDVARQLGARVRDVRRSPPPPGEPTRLERPPSRPFAVEIGTRTFAARAELASAESSPGTRKMAPSLPPPSEDAPADRVETMATRPLETGGERDPAPRRFGWITPPLAVALGVGAFVAGGRYVEAKRGAAEARPNVVEIPAATASSPAAPPPSVSPSEPVSSASASAPVTGPDPAPPEPVPEDGRLTAYCDPGTVLAIDGAGARACPVHDVPLKPGPHTLVFTFRPTGESRAETIVVRSGVRTTLRADFTGASPSIRVQR